MSGSSAPKSSGGLFQLFGSLSLLRNPLFRHADKEKDKDKKDRDHVGRNGKTGLAGLRLGLNKQSGHVRSASSATTVSDSVDRVDADRGVAPLATVGSEGTSRSRVHSPSVGRGLLQEVDEELGYPAANIIEYWRCKERKLNCMRSNMSAHDTVHRRHMVDWLSELSEELRLQPITTHSAISLLDEVMGLCNYSARDWRLQAVCCLNVAAKQEEAERNMPMVSELAAAAELMLSTNAVTQGELRLAQALDWKLSRVTPMHFLGYYLHGGVTFEGDLCQGRALVSKVTRYMKKYVEFFANLCQQDYGFLQHMPSEIAAASILAARRALCISPLWRPELQNLTGYSQSEINPCAQDLWGFYTRVFPSHQPLRSGEQQVREVNRSSSLSLGNSQDE